MLLAFCLRGERENKRGGRERGREKKEIESLEKIKESSEIFKM